MDITTVFGTVMLGSKPGRCTRKNKKKNGNIKKRRATNISSVRNDS